MIKSLRARRSTPADQPARRSGRLVALAAAAAAALHAPALPQPAAEPPAPVRSGRQASSELVAGSARRHSLALAAGQLVEIELRERDRAWRWRWRTRPAPRCPPPGVGRPRDIVPAAVGRRPRQEPVLEVRDLRPGRAGPLRAAGRGAAPGRPGDVTRVAADHALAEAAHLLNDSKRREALEHLARAEAGFREAGDRRGLAVALRDRGTALADSANPARPTR
jgi:hypothetical protein